MVWGFFFLSFFSCVFSGFLCGRLPKGITNTNEMKMLFLKNLKTSFPMQDFVSYLHSHILIK